MRKWVVPVLVGGLVIGAVSAGGYYGYRYYQLLENRLKAIETKQTELESNIQAMDKKLKELDRKSKALSDLFEDVRSNQQKLKNKVDEEIDELLSFGTDAIFDLKNLPPPPEPASPDMAAHCEDPSIDGKEEVVKLFRQGVPISEDLLRIIAEKHLWDYYNCLQGLPSSKYKD